MQSVQQNHKIRAQCKCVLSLGQVGIALALDTLWSSSTRRSTTSSAISLLSAHLGVLLAESRSKRLSFQSLFLAAFHHFPRLCLSVACNFCLWAGDHASEEEIKYSTDDETAPCVIKQFCWNAAGVVMDLPTMLKQAATDADTLGL